jgi:hypothetical protein
MRCYIGLRVREYVFYIFYICYVCMYVCMCMYASIEQEVIPSALC